MTEQNVNVTQVVQNQGCMSGCFTLFAVLAVIGLAVEYWYVSVGVLVVAALAGWLYWRQQQELQPASDRLRASRPDTAATGRTLPRSFHGVPLDTKSLQATTPQKAEKQGLPFHGRGWFRTSDLSRVKRALSH